MTIFMEIISDFSTCNWFFLYLKKMKNCTKTFTMKHHPRLFKYLFSATKHVKWLNFPFPEFTDSK